MDNYGILTQEDPLYHFVKRAQDYDRSSLWVDDRALIRKICDLAESGSSTEVLDIGIGTGKIARAFYGRVKYVVGVDICKEMVKQAKECADKIVLTPAENLPFKNNVFDVCVCRQGLQFMKLDDVLSEIYRVLKPGGRTVLCHLAAYCKEDKVETFLIQRLRNPARKNFFLPEDFSRILGNKSFTNIESFEYITKESVNRWINNGALEENKIKKIREVYKNASQLFKKLHNIEFKDGDIFDSMKMMIVRARKREMNG